MNGKVRFLSNNSQSDGYCLIEIITDKNGSDLHTKFSSNDNIGYEFELFKIMAPYQGLLFVGEDTDSKIWRTQIEFSLKSLGFHTIISHEKIVGEKITVGRITCFLEGRVVCLVYPIVKYQPIVACDANNGHTISFKIPMTYGCYERAAHPQVCHDFIADTGVPVKRYSGYGADLLCEHLQFKPRDKAQQIRSDQLEGSDPAYPENKMTLVCGFIAGKLNHVSWTESGGPIDRPLRTYNVINKQETVEL